MPKYYFQLQGGPPRDKVAVELTTDDEARREAKRVAADFNCKRVVVTNEQGHIVGEEGY